MKHLKLLNYPDDKSASNSGNDLGSVIENLEEDADSILQFIASNGWV